MGKAGDKTKLDRVSADAEDDRDRCGRSFGRLSASGDARRSDNGDATANEVSHERRQAIVLPLQPVVLDHRVLAFDVAGFVEAFTECSDGARRGIGRPTADQANDRHCLLLRVCRERPRGRTATEHG
ncbi:MAG TPA: hypothetical protein VKF35_20765 [Hyphomicrobiaceae bacterium]|nr:hypothetical protein [Hyphomicrobiaceae bacterium]